MPIPDLIHQEPAQASFACVPPRDTSFPFRLSDPGAGGPIFFAIQPPPSTAACISRLAWHLRDKHRLQGRPLRPQCFHVSLQLAGYYGRMPAATLADFIKAASTIRMPPFRVSFDWVMSFGIGERHALVLRGDEGVDGLVWLRDKLLAATMDIRGAAPSARNFTPHLTLLYDEQKVREEPVEEIGWTVNEFVLIRSVYGEGRHIPLARWKLHG
jgi:2'-5' RNA ligase